MKIDPKTSNKLTNIVTFTYTNPRAQAVYLIGAFNDWNQTSDPMQRQADGSWYVQVPLSRGLHYYQFLVDGEVVADPNGPSVSFREKNVSIIAIA